MDGREDEATALALGKNLVKARRSQLPSSRP